MSAVTVPLKLLTIEEYLRRPDDGTPSELVRGRVVNMSRPDQLHGFVCSNLDGIIREFVRANNLGRVMTCDAGIVTERDPDTVRGADVCFYSYDRIPRGPLLEGLLPAVPELAVEVLSSSDRWSQVFGKIKEYLTAGVIAVCVVNPRDRTATVYRDNQDPAYFSADADLTLPDVLPGFRVPVRQFFE